MAWTMFGITLAGRWVVRCDECGAWAWPYPWELHRLEPCPPCFGWWAWPGVVSEGGVP